MRVILSKTLKTLPADFSKLADDAEATIILSKFDLLDLVGAALAKGAGETIRTTADVARFEANARTFL